MTSDLSEGHLLDGRVRYVQPRRGYRTGIEPVLLAAAVPARPGERAIEAGTGAGAAMLCLSARIPDLTIIGVERDAKMAALACQNIASNQAFRHRVVVSDITQVQEDIGVFDHALANPPWHDSASTVSPNASKDAAKRGADGLIGAWCSALAKRLRQNGTLTLVLNAGALERGLAALRASYIGDVTVMPLWPRREHPARIILLQGRRGSRGSGYLLPGLVLHEEKGYSEGAQRILREAGSLEMHLPGRRA